MEVWSGKLRFDFNGEKQYKPNKSEWTIYYGLLIPGLSCEKDLHACLDGRFTTPLFFGLVTIHNLSKSRDMYTASQIR